MIVENLYEAISTQKLYKHHIGKIKDGRFFPITLQDLEVLKRDEVYELLENCEAGDKVKLAGHDTIFNFEITLK